MMKRRLFLLLLGSLLFNVASADVTGVVPFPGPFNITLSVNNVVIEQPTSGPLPINTPINELLPNNPQVRITPSSLTIQWRISCSSAGELVTSNFSLLRYRGQVVGGSGPIGGTLCTPPTKTISESFTLPQSVIALLLRDLFDQTISQVVGTQTIRDSAQLTIFREFESNIVGAAQGEATIIINGLLDAQVNLTRLISVNGRVLGNPTVAVGRAGSSFSAVWSAVVEVFGRGGNFTVNSDRIDIITPSGQLLESLGSPLTRRLPAALISQRRLTEEFRESVRISPSAIQRARQLKAANLLIARTFRGGNVQLTARIPLSFGGASAGEFTILSEHLYFDTGEQFKLVTPGKRLYAVADLNYGGIPKMLRARWMWAPDPGAGQPLFRPVPGFNVSPDQLAAVQSECAERSGRATRALVTEQLTGLQLATLCSPPLPTDKEGPYLLRLQIDEPEVVFSPLPTIRYVVGAGAAGLAMAAGLPNIVVIAPAPGAELNKEARFGWLPQGDMKAYRVDCYRDEKATGSPVASVWASGGNNAVAVTGIALRRLPPGPVYCQVIGIDKHGGLGAASKVTKYIKP